MDANRLIQMVIRMVMRRGVNMGIDYATRRGKDAKTMSPEEREQARSAKDIAGKARRGARLARRMGKF